MQRLLISGMALLLGVATLVRTARSLPAPASKPDPLTFVFLRVDPAQNLAILRPMIAPDIGVQLDSGPRELKRGTVLRCTTSIQEHSAIVEGQVGKISELVLDCLPAADPGGGQKFIVKGLDFSPRAK